MRFVRSPQTFDGHRTDHLYSQILHSEAYTRPICYLRLYKIQALLLLMPILTPGKVHTGLQYILSTHFPQLSILIPMGVPLQTLIFFPSKNITLLSGPTIHHHYKDLRSSCVVIIAVFSHAIWTEESRHYSSFDCLPLMLQIDRQCRSSQRT